MKICNCGPNECLHPATLRVDFNCKVYLAGQASRQQEIDKLTAELDAWKTQQMADATGHMFRCAKVNGEWVCAMGCAKATLNKESLELIEVVARKERAMRDEAAQRERAEKAEAKCDTLTQERDSLTRDSEESSALLNAVAEALGISDGGGEWDRTELLETARVCNADDYAALKIKLGEAEAQRDQAEHERQMSLLQQQLDRLRDALGALVDRLAYVHQHPQYVSVWVISQAHVGPYQGPNYIEELDDAKALLVAAPPAQEPVTKENT